MRARCSPKYQDADRYHERGIRVCERWDKSFENFLADMGLPPSSAHSIDRIDNDGNYEPGNCRWSTKSEQARNRSNNRWIEFNGERLLLIDWAARLGIKPQKIYQRLRQGVTNPALLLTA